MKNIRCIAGLACAAALLLAACTADDADMPAPAEEVAIVYPTLSIGVSEMTFDPVTAAEEAADAETRAQMPMSPDVEKYVHTLALFQFDSEGMHIRGDNTFHFIDFRTGILDDDKIWEPNELGVVEISLDSLNTKHGLSFERREGTIYAIANLEREVIDDFYKTHHEEGQSEGRMMIDRFQDWELPIGYKEEPAGTYDERLSGHVDTMYMFGFYKGKIDTDITKGMRIDLGRLVSRLDITIVNETGSDIKKRLGYHFDNVGKTVFFFPIKSRVPEMSQVGRSRTIVCSGLNDDGTVDRVDNAVTVPDSVFEAGGVHTRYFYVAAHSAKDFSEATKLHLFYNRRIVGDDSQDMSNSFQIPMCNVHPDEAANVFNGYSLSRNTRYHFIIRLKDRSELVENSAESAGSAGETPNTRSVVYGENPGDITVYLP